MFLLGHAIYDHGQMKWQGDMPQVERARVIVTVLAGLSDDTSTTKHQPSARIAGKGKIMGDIISPAAPLEDWNCGKRSAAPHLRRHRPAHVH